MALKEARKQKKELKATVDKLKEELGRAWERVKELWRINCLQLSGFDAAL